MSICSLWITVVQRALHFALSRNSLEDVEKGYEKILIVRPSVALRICMKMDWDGDSRSGPLFGCDLCKIWSFWKQKAINKVTKDLHMGWPWIRNWLANVPAGPGEKKREVQFLETRHKIEKYTTTVTGRALTTWNIELLAYLRAKLHLQRDDLHGVSAEVPHGAPIMQSFQYHPSRCC